MIPAVLDYIELYASSIPYVIFFCLFNDAEDRMKKTFLFLLPYNLLFFLVYRASLLIPNEFFGMLIKTLCSRILVVLFFHKTLKLSVLRTLLQSYLVSVVIVFTELLLSVFFNVSWFTNYLSAEPNRYYISFLSILHSLVEAIATYGLVKLLKKHYRNTVIPTRYLLTAILSLLPLIYQGALLFYFNTSSKRFPLPIMSLLILPAFIAALLPLYILSNETRLRKVISRLPEFVSAQNHLDRQMDYLKRQEEELEKAKQSLHGYRKQGDFSVSINDVYHSRENYIEGLYTDNPALHTLLSSYADRFEKEGIQYSFKMRSSTYTVLSDYFLIYLFSGLLDTARLFAELSFSRTANIYTIDFESDQAASDDLRSFLKTTRSMLEKKDLVTFKKNRTTASLAITIPAAEKEAAVS